MSSGAVVGIVLAAGAGSRAGGPKVLRRDPSGVPWVELAVRRLLDGGCATVLVVLGASAEQAASLVPSEAFAVRCDNWTDGLSASLRTGLGAAAEHLTAPENVEPVTGRTGGRFRLRLTEPPVAAVIVPVDVPDGSPLTVRRLLPLADASALVRATFWGRPGHPVLIGRDHWRPLADSLAGDTGASGYLVSNGVREVECGDLESGLDVDT